VNPYFDAAIAQLLERTRQLHELIPRHLGRDVAPLEVITHDRLQFLGHRLKVLRDAPELQRPENQRERLRIFRRLCADLDQLESIAVSVLCRWNQEDQRLNRLAGGLASEIRFPLPTPVVACISQGYYETHAGLRLIRVPLAEGRFLLHLPDLYHELAHSLLEFDNDARLASFQAAHVAAVEDAYRYLAGELQKERSGLGPDIFKRYLTTWTHCWMSWAIEFFCDLFALYMVGPAFAWAHLHLSATAAEPPFSVPSFTTAAHPADAARMRVLVVALERLGFRDQADAVSRRWERLLQLGGYRRTPEYLRCFPDSLLRRIEEQAYNGTVGLGCDCASPTMAGAGRKTLNEAWEVLWQSPKEYVDWERGAVANLATKFFSQ